MEGSRYSTVEISERAVQAVLNGKPVVEVAEAYQTDRTTIQRWLKRFRECGGFGGLKRRPVSGRPRKLKALSESQIKAIVLAPASDFGFETDLWTPWPSRPSAVLPFACICAISDISCPENFSSKTGR